MQSPPSGLVLDIDASDIPLHGQQELREFHGYYDQHCYLPLYVFCGQALLACYLRRSRIDGAKNASALIKLLVQRLRQAWPEVPIIVRGDSGFCRQRLMRWCERHGVGYILGVARNARLEAIVSMAELALAEQYAASGSKQREIGEFSYAADSWDRERRVITRLEYGAQGNNPRFVVTNVARRAGRAVRPAVLPARGGREPHQGDAARSVRHTRQLPQVPRQPVSPAAGRPGLHPDAATARSGPAAAPSSRAPARPPSARGCSRSVWACCATPVACA